MKKIELLLINLAMLVIGFYLGLVFLKVNAEPVIVYHNIPYEVTKTEYVKVPVETEIIREVVRTETEYVEVPVPLELMDFESVEQAETVIAEVMPPVRSIGNLDTMDSAYDCDNYALELIDRLKEKGYRTHLAPVYYGRIFGFKVTAGFDYLHVGVWLIIQNRFYYVESAPGAGRGELVLITGNDFDLYVD